MKKGALELGINTVVLLVIALVVIAGGIAFIAGVFDRLINIDVGPVELKFEANSVDTLVLSGKPELKMGSEEKLDISVYNKLGVDKEINIVFDTCTSSSVNPNCAKVVPVLVALPRTVPSNDAAGFRTIIKAKCASDEKVKLAPGEYVCNLRAVTTSEPAEIIAESQVYVTVTS